MAILAFQKPEKVIMLESTSSFGKFEFRPLEPGFGMTVGNALRRILLSSLEGYAITTVKVAGVDHEFAAIPGVMEDMLNIILNLKQVRFIRTVDNQDAEKVSINVAGVTELTAGYISNYLSFFKVLNPDLVICHLAPGTKLQMTLTIGKGRGYVSAEENTPARVRVRHPSDRLDLHADQERKVFHRQLPCRAEDRLREVEPGDYYRRVDSPQRGSERGCKDPYPALHALLRREDHRQHGGYQRYRRVR